MKVQPRRGSLNLSEKRKSKIRVCALQMSRYEPEALQPNIGLGLLIQKSNLQLGQHMAEPRVLQEGSAAWASGEGSDCGNQHHGEEKHGFWRDGEGYSCPVGSPLASSPCPQVPMNQRGSTWKVLHLHLEGRVRGQRALLPFSLQSNTNSWRA